MAQPWAQQPVGRGVRPFWTALAAILLAAAAPGMVRAQVDSAGAADILVVKGPALFIQVADDPVLVPFDAEGTVERVANASGELYRDAETGTYWVRVGKTWLGANDLTGAYEKRRDRPKALSALPPNDPPPGLERVRSRDPISVYVRTRRTALVRLEGPLKFDRIGVPGGINTVTNTDADLFFHGREARYYLLAGGRWYTSTQLDSGWTATTEIAPLFRDIPPDHAQGYVLAAIPGTREHAAALAAAARFQLRTVSSDRTTTIQYAGTPEFEPIRGTAVAAAVNTTQDVFSVEGMYYACAEGVWYLAASPAGPWTVCAVVPDALYAIPATHPKHHVTAVVVYPAEQPGYVTVGADARYAGWRVVDGTLVHRTWDGAFPTGAIYAGEYVGPYANGEYLAPDYGNWGRGDWAAQRAAMQATQPMGAAAPRTPPAISSTPDSRWDLDARRQELSNSGTPENPEWYGTPAELEDRRHSPRSLR